MQEGCWSPRVRDKEHLERRENMGERETSLLIEVILRLNKKAQACMFCLRKFCLNCVDSVLPHRWRYGIKQVDRSRISL